MTNALKQRNQSGWSTVKLADVAVGMLSGGTPSTKNHAYWRGTIPWITSKWINDELYLRSGEKFISHGAIENSASKVVPSGNLIFATRVGVGKVAVNSIDLAINQDLAGIVVDNIRVLPEFLAYQLRTDRVQKFVEQNKRGATIKGITSSCLREIRVQLPPLPEQRRIAAVLSLVQRAIEQQARLIAVTTELKKALMRILFTEGTRGEPQKETEIGPIPQSWDEVPFGELIDVAQYGLSIRANDIGSYPVLRMTNQIGGKIVANDLKYVDLDDDNLKRFCLLPGDILFNRTNSFDLVGRTAIFELIGDYVFASYLIRLRVKKEYLNPFFLSHYFNWDTTQARLKSIATRAVSQSNISATRLKGFVVPLPSLKEQEEIVTALDSLDLKQLIHQKHKDSLYQLFRTLLHKLMTAEIRVNELDLGTLGLDTENPETSEV